MSLLEKAKRKQPRKTDIKIPFNNESVELFVALLNNEITYRQAADVIKQEYGLQISTAHIQSRIGTIIRQAIIEGNIEINKLTK